MLHNISRELLLQTGRGNAALLIDGLLFCGWSAGEVFSYADAYDYLHHFGTSEKLIRAGLNDPLFKRQGTRDARYTLPSPTDVLEALNLFESPYIDKLEGKDFKSLSAYRLALHVAFLERLPGEYSQKLLSKRLGVTRATTIRYNKVADIYVEPRFSYTPITQHNINALPAVAHIQRGAFWLEIHTAPNVIPKKTPMVRGAAAKWLKNGAAVYLTKQLPNYYEVRNVA